MDKVNQIKHMMNFQRKATELVTRQFEEACFFPEQYKLILESTQSEKLAEEIIDRLGITSEAYTGICDNALKQYETYTKRQELRYSYSEIGSAHSGPKKISDNKANRSVNAQVKIRAIISKNQTANNVLEEVIQWRKFESV